MFIILNVENRKLIQASQLSFEKINHIITYRLIIVFFYLKPHYSDGVILNCLRKLLPKLTCALKPTISAIERI